MPGSLYRPEGLPTAEGDHVRHLSEPLQVGPVTVPNRLVFPAHLTNYAVDGRFTERHAAYYAARAAGGVGLVVTEEVSTDPADRPYEKLVRGWDPDALTGMRLVVDAVHAHGVPVFAQVNHNGGQSDSLHTRTPVLAPSPVPDPLFREVPREANTADLTRLVAGYAEVAARCAAAGFDGVEVQASQSSLVRQFLSRATNRRTDRYGDPGRRRRPGGRRRPRPHPRPGRARAGDGRLRPGRRRPRADRRPRVRHQGADRPGRRGPPLFGLQPGVRRPRRPEPAAGLRDQPARRPRGAAAGAGAPPPGARRRWGTGRTPRRRHRRRPRPRGHRLGTGHRHRRRDPGRGVRPRPGGAAPAGRRPRRRVRADGGGGPDRRRWSSARTSASPSTGPAGSVGPRACASGGRRSGWSPPSTVGPCGCCITRPARSRSAPSTGWSSPPHRGRTTGCGTRCATAAWRCTGSATASPRARPARPPWTGTGWAWRSD